MTSPPGNRGPRSGKHAADALLLGVSLAVGSALVGACGSEPTERPPILPGQPGGMTWVSPGGSSHGGATGGGGSDSSGGSASGGQAATVGRVSGRVVAFVSDDFFFTETWSDDGEVAAQVPPSGNWERKDYDGTVYRFDAAERGPGSFFAAFAADDASGYVPTVSNQGALDGRADLPLVPSVVLEGIYDNLLVPSAPGAGAGQLVVRFRDLQGQAVEGVNVALSGSEFVSYADRGAWTEYGDQTTSAGLAFVGNTLAARFPGGLFDVVLSGTALSDGPRTLRVPLSAGAVTVATVTVSPGGEALLE